MAVYRFRIEIEDHDNLFREIEIKSSQTFQDLHFSILQAFGFDLKHAASFFYSDDLWHMEDEIVYELSPYSRISDASPMSKVRIGEFIDDPHQRFLYVYQSDEGWVFLTELVNINTNIPKHEEKYPRIVKSVGEAPKQYPVKNVFRPLPTEDIPISVVDEIADAAAEPAADDLVMFETLEAGASKAPKEADDDPLSLGSEIELNVDPDDLHGMHDDQDDENGTTDDDGDSNDTQDNDGLDDDDDYSGRGNRGRREMGYDSDDY